MKTTVIIYKLLFTAAMLAAWFMVSCSGERDRKNEVSSTSDSDSSEWIDLFDGKTLDGWKRYGASEIGTLWRVEDGAIVSFSEGGGEANVDQGGSLITKEKFDNFELVLDWKISPGGNSGILYHVVEDPAYKRAYETGPEYQLLDESAYPEVTALTRTASNYDLYAPSTEVEANPPGEFPGTLM